jgi:penicillin-insensitive murein DD-endopeptidase
MMLAPVRSLVVLLVVGIGPALAQDAGAQNRVTYTLDPTPRGTLEQATLPPLPNGDARDIPAKQLFVRKLTPLAGAAHAIGGYNNGCMAGGQALPITGPTWQVMRLSRNRNWGNPKLIEFIKRLGDNAKKIGWNGLLIGDMAQPRGGPMLDGHASHQTGLDVDIWFSPMPDHELTREEREMQDNVNVAAPNGRDVDKSLWTPVHTALLKAAAQDPDVVRIFVNPAIKKAMCREAGVDRAWLAKLRPTEGHAEHFHVRLSCPTDSPQQCEAQGPVPGGDGCAELDRWFAHANLNPKLGTPAGPREGKKLAALPAACRQVVKAP